MKGEAGKEGGARVRKLGGGRICLMSMFGMGIASRMPSGFRTVHSMQTVINTPRRCSVFSLIGL